MQKCSGCEVKKKLSEFGEKSPGIYYKTCIKCREKQNKKCSHGNTEYICTECNPNIVCEHGYNRKYDCPKCNPNIVCEHDVRKQGCSKCNPDRFCEHDARKYDCPKCNPSKACQNCFYVYVDYRSRYKPYCFRCFCVLNPHIEIPRRYKTKEFYLQNDLITRFPNLKMIFDKQISGGCSKRRPDIFIELFSHVIIVEMDEDQHKNYVTDCELSRIADIHNDIGHRPLIILRFNPDKYLSGDNIQNPGCFIYSTDNGEVQCDEEEWESRFELLYYYIEYYRHAHNIPDTIITQKWLFYDEILII